MIYGNQLRKAQSHFLNSILEHSSILIIGGGTGWILTEFKQKNITIDYLERSAEMIKLAKKKKNNFEVNFIHDSKLNSEKHYDVIITPFVLDCIPHNELDTFVKNVAKQVKSKGKWICTDFNSEDKRFVSKLLTKLMLVFFKITTQIPVNKLLNYFTVIEENGFTSLSKYLYIKGFVKTEFFEKE